MKDETKQEEKLTINDKDIQGTKKNTGEKAQTYKY